jgi:hypothetical protein
MWLGSSSLPNHSSQVRRRSTYGDAYRCPDYRRNPVDNSRILARNTLLRNPKDRRCRSFNPYSKPWHDTPRFPLDFCAAMLDEPQCLCSASPYIVQSGEESMGCRYHEEEL